LLSRKHLGPAISGALGGTAAVAVATLAIFYIRRRARQAGDEQADPDDPLIISDQQEREKSVIAAGLHNDSVPLPPLGQGSNHRTSDMYQLQSEREVPLATVPLNTSIPYSPPHHETPTPPTSKSREEEESQLLGRMYSLNMPAADIARAAEVMRAQRETAQGAGSGTVAEVRPPPYSIGSD
jgi:hypothetical protein